MSALPHHRPKHLSLGPLESEILEILWDLGAATTKTIHEQILSDPDRELAYASVTTVLQRLTQKGWVRCDRQERSFRWHPRLSRQQAQTLRSYDRLQEFLSVSDPDMVAAFAHQLDPVHVEQLQAIAARVQAARQAREQGQ